MARKSTSEDTHGKNSIEAAADTAIDALHAVKSNLETGDVSGSNARSTREKAAGDTKKFLHTVSDSASDVAATAADALGASIPEANKGESSSQRTGTARPVNGGNPAGKRAAKSPSKTAQELVDDANRAISALEAEAKDGIAQGRRSVDDASKRVGASARDAASGLRRDFDSARAEASREGSRLQGKGQEFGEHVAGTASRLSSAIREGAEKVKEGAGKVVERTEQAAHNLLPSFGSHRQSTEEGSSLRGASYNQNGDGRHSWSWAAQDEASRAGHSAESAFDRAKDSAHSLTEAVASTYHEVKESAKATVTDFEEGAKSALDRLRARLDADMEPHNFVDHRLSLGLIPSNTEEVLASRAIASKG